MKKLIFTTLSCAALVLCLASCDKKKAAEAPVVNTDSIENVKLTDSLATVQAERDTLMALVSEVSDGMNQLLDAQRIISSSSFSSEAPDKKQQMLTNLVSIKQALNKRAARIAELEKKLKQSGTMSAEMQKQIGTLKEQVANQQEIIADLSKKLEEANVKITGLNTQVDELKTTNANVTAERDQAKATVAQKEKQVTELTDAANVCYYVVGTKSELKKQKIIETGFLKRTKVMEGDYAKSYFTKADRRTLSEIKLYNKKAQVMSKHPAGSYEIVDEGGQKVLKITNPNRFWELSNYLVVKVG